MTQLRVFFRGLWVRSGSRQSTRGVSHWTQGDAIDAVLDAATPKSQLCRNVPPLKWTNLIVFRKKEPLLLQLISQIVCILYKGTKISNSPRTAQFTLFAAVSKRPTSEMDECYRISREGTNIFGSFLRWIALCVKECRFLRSPGQCSLRYLQKITKSMQ